MTAQGQGETPRHSRFPALDPEPPPRSWRRRAVPPAAVIMLAGATAAAVVFWPSAPRTAGNRGARAAVVPAVAARGQILVQTHGGLALAGPDGEGTRRLRALGRPLVPVAAAPDRRFLAAPDGEIIAIRPGQPPAVASTRLVYSADRLAPWPDPFADRDRVLIMLESPFGSVTASYGIAAVSLATGRLVSLGHGASAAGDPQAPGAFVSVAAPPRPSASVTQLTADARIELRDAGRRPVLLATAAALSRDARLNPRLPVALFPYPDPSGRRVAVRVVPVSGGGPAGVVILSRAGRPLGSVPGGAGRLASLPVTWSPSGATAGFVATNQRGAPELVIWPLGGQPRVRLLPDRGEPYARCVWSPDGTVLLCASVDSATNTARHWVIARASGGEAASAAGAPGFPVAWLPPGGGG